MKRSIFRVIMIVAVMTLPMAACEDACDRQFYDKLNNECDGFYFGYECCMGDTEEDCDMERDGAHWTCCNNPECRQEDDN